MADGTDVFAAKGSVFGSTIADRLKNSNVSQIDKIITVVNGKLKWNEDFESLKYFIKTTLNLTGKWSSLGGHLKPFDEDSGRLIVSSLPYNDTGYPCSSTICDNILPGELETGVSEHAKANIACQTFGEETVEIQTLHTNSQVNRTQQVITDIKSLKTTIIKLESIVHSLENTIKDHDAVEEERDSLQLAIRLIAQDKYCQNEAATSATINSESCNHKEWSKNKSELLNEDINNSSGHLENNHERFEVNSIHSTHTSREQPHSAPNPDLHVETISPNKQTPCQSNNDENNQVKKSNSDSPIVLIGDSIVKNINPKKISKKKVIKRTFPGKNAEEIKHEIKSIPTNSTPSHVIIHVGTNNLPINTADECVKNIEDLAHSGKARFPGSRIALSSIIGWHDIDIT
ncbi:Hypothetical predicted protein [Paramuricea clavata]|uniref:Uncharacterized protein n=1 Tax=Paramuricea clavata TaxID=317549 RepID=A0A7D9HAU8_PARCT|nr:Hypothetical predicted protein [Paramuricea clavata]